MTPEKQRIAIAEACGWRTDSELVSFGWRPSLCAIPTYKYAPIDRVPLPDYLNDLNAMHEAEEVLTEWQKEAYALVISELIPEDDGFVKTPYVPSANAYIGYIECPAGVTFKMIHATAAQRAEAFLRTIGKWED